MDLSAPIATIAELERYVPDWHTGWLLLQRVTVPAKGCEPYRSFLLVNEQSQQRLATFGPSEPCALTAAMKKRGMVGTGWDQARLEPAKYMYSEVVRPQQRRKLMFDLDGIAAEHEVEAVALAVAQAAHDALVSLVADVDSIYEEFDLAQWHMVGRRGDRSVHLVCDAYSFEAQVMLALYEETKARLPAEYRGYLDKATSQPAFMMRIAGSGKVEGSRLMRKSSWLAWTTGGVASEPSMAALLVTHTRDAIEVTLAGFARRDSNLESLQDACDSNVRELLELARASDEPIVSQHMDAFVVSGCKSNESLTTVDFARTKSLYCPGCERVHDADGMYALAYGPEERRTKMLFRCRRDDKKRTLFVVRTPDHKETQSECKEHKAKRMEIVRKACSEYKRVHAHKLAERGVQSIQDIRELDERHFEDFTELFDCLMSCYWWSSKDGVWIMENGKWEVDFDKSGYTTLLTHQTYYVGSDPKPYSGAKFCQAIAMVFNRKPSVYTDQQAPGLPIAREEPYNCFESRQLCEPSANYQRNVAELEAFVSEQLASTETREFATWLLNWCAHVVQKPLEKTGVMAVLCGRRGAGKSLFLDMLCRLVRTHEQVNNKSIDAVAGKFNGILRRKTLLVFGELVAGRSITDQELGCLKSLITDRQMSIELKGREAFREPNYLNVVAACNDPRSITVEAGDRRICVISSFDPVHYGTAEDESCSDYWARISDLFEDEEFLSDAYRYFATRNIAEFRPAVFPRSDIRELAVRQSKLAMYLLEQAKGQYERGQVVPIADFVHKCKFETGDPTNPLALAQRVRIEVATNADVSEVWQLSEDKDHLVHSPRPVATKVVLQSMNDPSKLTHLELKKLLRSKSIKVPCSATKAQLLELWRASQESHLSS